MHEVCVRCAFHISASEALLEVELFGALVTSLSRETCFLLWLVFSRTAFDLWR